MDINKIKMKKRIEKYIIITLALLLNAICFNMFLIKLKIASGGVNGISTILKYLFNIDQSITLFIQDALLLVVSAIFLGKDKTKKALYASIAYPVLVKLTEFVSTIDFNNKDMLVIIIFAGIITGLANGSIYKIGYNAGGYGIISTILFEKFRISISKSVLVINLLIIALGGYFFGSTQAMYAIILLYINNIVMDKVIVGISNNKAFYIVTTKSNEVNDYILNVLGHGTTIFEVKRHLFEKKKQVLLTVIPSSEYYRVTEGIKMIDKDVFFVATDSYEVKGAS